MWGVWEREDGMHVIPSDNDGFVVEGHEIDPSCYCNPVMEQDLTMFKPVWVHRECS